MTNLLGLDYGEKHIGVAVATTFIAEPLEVVPAGMILDRIKELIMEFQIKGFVVGLSENQMAEKSRGFAQLLSDRFRLPVYFQDETLSSQDTRRELARLGLKRSKREAKTDHFVAATLLQEFLDTNQSELQ